MTNETDYLPVRYVGNGATTEFAFNWKAFSDSDLIVKLIDSDENEETLVLGEDYSVKIESAGGNVIFSTAPDSDKIIFIARDVSNYQSASYSTSVGFQGSELEKSFDKVSCNLQEMDYNIETFKTEFSEEINELIEKNKEDIDNQIETFENEINSTITEVNEAAKLIETTINNVNEALETCTQKADEASNSAAEAKEEATVATEQASEVKETYEEAMSAIEEAKEDAVATVKNRATTSLDNLTATGLSQYNVFCINTGNTDEDGNPSFLTYSDGVLTTSGALSLTSADGTIYTISDTLSYSSSDLEDGEYNILINPVDKEIILTTNTITAGSAFPSDAVSGDYLLNISKVPYDLEQITITTTTDDEGIETTTSTITKGLNLVLAGTLTI